MTPTATGGPDGVGLRLGDAAERFLRASIAGRTLRPASVSAYRYALANFKRFVGGNRDVARISRRDVARWRDTMTDRSARTVQVRLTAVASLYTWLVGQGIVSHVPTHGVKRPTPRPSVPRGLAASTVARVFDACDGDARLELVVSLMTVEALTAAEVARLCIEDIDLDGDVLDIAGNGRGRLVPLTVASRRRVDAYLAERPATRGPLVRRRDDEQGVTAKLLSRLVVELMYQAGVKRVARDGMSSLALRHTAASDALARCGDLEVVRELLGHQSVASTQGYARRAKLDKVRTAIEGRDYSGR